MTHRDGFPRLSARNAWRGDAGHRETCAPSESYGPPENLGKPFLWVIISEIWYYGQGPGGRHPRGRACMVPTSFAMSLQKPRNPPFLKCMVYSEATPSYIIGC